MVVETTTVYRVEEPTLYQSCAPACARIFVRRYILSERGSMEELKILQKTEHCTKPVGGSWNLREGPLLPLSRIVTSGPGQAGFCFIRINHEENSIAWDTARLRPAS